MTSIATNPLDVEAWADTDLGDPMAWPGALRTSAQLCLSYPTPCCLLWGERSEFFYNTAMAAAIGVRHPAGMGRPLYDVLPHMWRTIGPIVHEVMRTGLPFTATRFPIQADLGEGVGQFFVDFTFVPVRDEDGRVVGVFAPVGNNTVAHLDSQHHATVAAVATVPTGLARADVVAQVARHLVVPDDVRFAVVFLRDPETGALVRAGTAGAPLRPAASQAALDVAVARGLWPLERVLADRRAPEPVDGAPHGSRVSRPLWENAWLVALPAPVDGVLVLGMDARYALPGGPVPLITRLAAAAGERLAR